MKKFGIIEMLGRRSRCKYRLPGAKYMFLHGKLPAGTAVKAPPLSSVMGQYGIRMDEFCIQFNTYTEKLWEIDLLIPFTITVTPSKQMSYVYGIPTTTSFLNKLLLTDYVKSWYGRRFKNPIRLRLFFDWVYYIALAKIPYDAVSYKKQAILSWSYQILCNSYSFHLLEKDRLVKIAFNWRRKKKKR